MAAVVFFSFVWTTTDFVPAPGSEPTVEPARTVIPLQPTFYQEHRFRRAITAATETVPDPQVRAAIVPHHLVASDGIAALLAGMKREGIERVIIIGPNHEDKNPSTVTSAHAQWETPSGPVNTDVAGVDSFLAALDVRAYPAAFEQEHSIGALIPFVRHYFPEAAIVPVLFNSTAGFTEAQLTAAWLAEQADERTLILFSLDFSHYQTPAAAAGYDAVTKEVILTGDAGRVATFDERFVDSRATLMAALQYAAAAALQPTVVFEADANDFLETPAAETTTYFGVYWR